jgi:hypothetical protein
LRPRGIAHLIVISAVEFTKSRLPGIAFVYRLYFSKAEQTRQNYGVVVIRLFSITDQFVIACLTHSNGCHQWLEQFIQPGRPAPFFDDNMRCAAQSAKIIAEIICLGSDFRHTFNLSLFVKDCNYTDCFMDIQTDIL